MKIGVMDSGSGGLAILAALQERFPNSEFVYTGDSVGFPYSPKTPAELRARAELLTRLLLTEGCQLVVIACNTLTVHAIAHLRQVFPNVPFVGTVPAVAEAARMLAAHSPVLVLATQATATSSYLAQLLAPLQSQIRWQVIGATELVQAVEEQNLAAQQQVVTSICSQLETPPVGVVIGCTHFSAAKAALSALSDNTLYFFEPQQGICNQVARVSVESHEEMTTKTNPAAPSITWLDTADQEFRYKTLYEQNLI